MEQENLSEVAQDVLRGLEIAKKRMLKEKALRDEDIVIADNIGNIHFVSARKILAENPEYQD